MTVATRKKYTYSDFLKFPDDGNRHEILDGEWFMTPPPTPDHQRVVSNLLRLLGTHVRSRRLGEVFPSPIGVRLSAHDVVQPEVLFVSRARRSIERRDGFHGAPDLVVEVTSPSTAGIDRGPKSDLYRRSGVREYWMVDPFARTVEVRDFGRSRRTSVFQEGQSIGSALLPGLSLAVHELFRGLR